MSTSVVEGTGWAVFQYPEYGQGVWGIRIKLHCSRHTCSRISKLELANTAGRHTRCDLADDFMISRAH